MISKENEIQSINKFSFIYDRNDDIATFMFTNLSIIRQYNTIMLRKMRSREPVTQEKIGSG